ncbi:hypothetical protein IU500_07155 [Nocardia terpenica]|uniref:hypothetical protein n=1 Tax=Nocardia terpenica TaxID=455432 RepID=UPI0018957BA8|nr:hypothetical protein [Nocardia terpenica]MBF6060555.1 hypothetical protein [Nocardia terpenica]MBF6103815.1 hypothetical protein [Nocardia terpenica]MBF6111811.1 hypothetical protein [Nocardia terpenica]MBF6118036.1 hypothetical protein [Nocardia terpenica]MBF6155238.1 hypothetical protein [Nocardia terpenica]
MTSKGTPRRTLRIADEIWDPAEARAEREGRKVVDVIREFLITFGESEGTEEK